MSDLYAQVTFALQHGGWAVLPLTLLLGIVSSLGPCSGPRLLALSGLIVRARRPLRVGGAFIAGQLVSYMAIGVAGIALLSQLSAFAGWLYLAIAASGLSAGAYLLLAARWCHRSAEHEVPKRDPNGTAFAAGAAFALLIQPCCTPVIVTIVAFAAIAWPWWMTFVMLAAFGLGHAAPVFLAGWMGEGLLRKLRRWRLQQATEIVSAASLLGVGAYYALLV